MQKIIVANWKCNPLSLKGAVSLAEKVDAKVPHSKNVEVVIAPPFPFLPAVGNALKNAALGAQDVFWENGGAYTSEVSPSQLKSVGVSHVIVGHSERRRCLAETDEMVNKKVLAALAAGLHVVLCVGEPWEARRNGIDAVKRFIERQLRAGLSGLSSRTASRRAISLTIAYEPVWAISGGNENHPMDTPENSAEIARFVRSFLSAACFLPPATPVLYGGSVKARNISAFLRREEIGGVLVGEASIKHTEFAKMMAIAARLC